MVNLEKLKDNYSQPADLSSFMWSFYRLWNIAFFEEELTKYLALKIAIFQK